jgi:hypothetical protein
VINKVYFIIGIVTVPLIIVLFIAICATVYAQSELARASAALRRAGLLGGLALLLCSGCVVIADPNN